MDPFELMLPPKRVEIIEEEEPRDYHEYFYDDLPPGGRDLGYHMGIHSSVCRFDENGDHVSMARDCPHFDSEDEEGRRIVPGWTAQTGVFYGEETEAST